MARWAREEGLLKPWERKFMYDMGRYVSRGWTVSPRQARQARRLHNEALSLGYNS
jgi:hypothetical protein